MVLADLGGQISSALQNLQNSTVIDEKVLNDLLNTIARALMQADVNFGLVKKIKTQILNEVKLDELASGINKRRAIQKAVFDNLVGLVSPSKTPYKPKKGKCNVVMFVGLQGSGKTTSIAKYAQWYKMKNWSCGMVCADTFRAGAFDQLKQNATRIKVPFYGSYTEADPVVIAKEGVEQFKKQGFEMIIVDTSGRHKQSDDLFEEMVRVKDAVQPDEIIFVMDSTIGQAAKDQAQAFSDSVEVGSVIITKLDGHAKGGGALSAVAMTGSPIVFIGTGEHFDDFEPFEARSFIKRLLGMGDLESLADELKAKGLFFLPLFDFGTIVSQSPCAVSSLNLFFDKHTFHSLIPNVLVPAGIFDQNPDMMKRMVQGLFSFRDMYQQFEQVKSLGPLGRVMSMIPGLPQGLMQKGQEREGQERIERFMYMMNSMNELELDGINDIDRSRAERIARGSGCNLLEVGMLLQSHQKVLRVCTPLLPLGAFHMLMTVLDNESLLLCMRLKMAQMVGNLGKNKLLNKTDMNDAKLHQQLKRNPQAVMQKLAKSMDPKMLQSIGGPQNMLKMMQQMAGGGGEGGGLAEMMQNLGGAGGMPDMSAMMNKMGKGRRMKRR